MSAIDQIKAIFVKPTDNLGLKTRDKTGLDFLAEDTTRKARRITIEKRQYVFGLEWRLMPPTRTLARTLKLAKQEEMVYYVLSEMEDLIGLTKELSDKRGVKYSGALHLASKMSQGGVELYVFALQKGVYAVVALNESRPIPGFDFLGSQQAARDMVEEFKAIQAGHQIRIFGNTGMFEGEETLEPEDIFGEPAKASRIKNIPGQSSTQYLIAFGIFLAIAIAGAMYWVNEQRTAVMEEVQATEVDPNKEYKISLQNSLRALPAPGPELLKDWLRQIEKLPLFHAGWRLSKIECLPGGCTAHWEREYGSYKDFSKQLPAYTVSVKEVQEGTDPLKVKILTTHKIVEDKTGENELQIPIDYKTIPAQQQGVREMSSQLQELSMLGSIQVTMSQPKLFGTTAAVSNLKEAIFSGDWSIEHEVWSLPEIEISPNVITKSLVLNFPPPSDKVATTYRLEGTYYVQEQKAP